jgi:hypothetical protein
VQPSALPPVVAAPPVALTDWRISAEIVTGIGRGTTCP